jgi:hypothetical protein
MNGENKHINGGDKPQSCHRTSSGSSPLKERESLRQSIRKGPAAFLVASISIFIIVISVYVVVESLIGVNDFNLDGQQGLGFDPANALALNIFLPLEGKVGLEQRLVPKVAGTRDMAAAAVGEFLAGPPEGLRSYVPDGVELTGVFHGKDGVLYLDFSSAMTLNFQGDAVAEFLLLRSLYKTLTENTSGVKGYRLLVDGSEVDTIGGHIYVLEGLEKAVPYRLMEEDEIE